MAGNRLPYMVNQPGKRPISLTGIKPTGTLVLPKDGGTVHLGNYLGAIRPALELSGQYDSIYFIADYHALTSQRDPEALRENTLDVAAAWLACGLDPEHTTIFRQSDVLEVFELSWVFACLVATGQLERGHAYKEAKEREASPNAGIFNYPLLMAADIILYDANVVPVGADQKQHLELARDIAIRMNHVYGEGTVVVPEAVISEAPIVPGIDGLKMSKSYGNTIPLFLQPKALRKALMKIKADSTPLDEPKVAEGAPVYELYRLVVSSDEAAVMAQKLRASGYGWGHAKEDLFLALEAMLGPLRQRYLELRANPSEIEAVLAQGAQRARGRAQQTMARVRHAIGIR